MGPSWNERYSDKDYVYGTAPNEFLASQVSRIRPGGRVISIGEGEGRNGVFLAEQGFQVTGYDGSEVGLAKAAKLAAARGVQATFIPTDLATAVFPAGVDALVNIFCHLPSALRRDVHRRALAALAPGGVAVLELYRPEQLQYQTGGPKDVDMLATLDALRGDFAGCELEYGQELVRDIHEGKFHTGTAAVVQAVFRKPA